MPLTPTFLSLTQLCPLGQVVEVREGTCLAGVTGQSEDNVQGSTHGREGPHSVDREDKSYFCSFALFSSPPQPSLSPALCLKLLLLSKHRCHHLLQAVPRAVPG